MLFNKSPDELHSINNNPPMNYTSATGLSVHQTVSLILATIHAEPSKLLSDVIVQNATLIAALSKGGGGDGNGGNNSNQGKGKGPESQDNDTALREWVSKNKPPHKSTLTPVHNYWTPLASQLEELDNPPPP